MFGEDGADLGDSAELAGDYIEAGSLELGAWHWVAVPLSVINPRNEPMAWIDIADASGQGASAFYVDEVRFVTAAP